MSWTHFIALIPLKDTLKRDYYSEMCRIEKWIVKTLRSKIDSMLYERTALSKKPELVAKAKLDRLGIHVAEYLTALPPKEILQDRPHRAIELARHRFENQLKVDL